MRALEAILRELQEGTKPDVSPGLLARAEAVSVALEGKPRDDAAAMKAAIEFICGPPRYFLWGGTDATPEGANADFERHGQIVKSVLFDGPDGRLRGCAEVIPHVIDDRTRPR